MVQKENAVQWKRKMKSDEIVAFIEQCDKCSARALVKAFFLQGELYFCFHHYRELDIGEKAYFLQFEDETEKLETGITRINAYE